MIKKMSQMMITQKKTRDVIINDPSSLQSDSSFIPL